MHIRIDGKGGLGSGAVQPAYQISVVEGIRRRLNGHNNNHHNNNDLAAACTIEQNTDYYQVGNPSSPGSSPQDCANQCVQNAFTPVLHYIYIYILIFIFYFYVACGLYNTY